VDDQGNNIVRRLLVGNVITALLASVAVLIASPAYSQPFIRFNSVGMDENDRGYELSAGNSNLEVGVGFDTTGHTSAIVLTRMSF